MMVVCPCSGLGARVSSCRWVVLDVAVGSVVVRECPGDRVKGGRLARRRGASPLTRCARAYAWSIEVVDLGCLTGEVGCWGYGVGVGTPYSTLCDNSF